MSQPIPRCRSHSTAIRYEPPAGIHAGAEATSSRRSNPSTHPHAVIRASGELSSQKIRSRMLGLPPPCKLVCLPKRWGTPKRDIKWDTCGGKPYNSTILFGVSLCGKRLTYSCVTAVVPRTHTSPQGPLQAPMGLLANRILQLIAITLIRS